MQKLYGTYTGFSKGYRRKRGNYVFRRILIALVFIALIVGAFFATSKVIEIINRNVQQVKTAEEKQFFEHLENGKFDEAKSLWIATVSKAPVAKRQKMDEGFKNVLNSFADKYIDWSVSDQYDANVFNSKYKGLDIFFGYIEENLSDAADELIAQFAQGTISYDDSVRLANQMLAFESAGALTTSVLDRIESVKVSAEKFALGEQKTQEGNYKDAIAAFREVTSPDSPLTEQAAQKIAEIEQNYFLPELNAIKDLYNREDYINAYNRLVALCEMFPDKQEATELLPAYKEAFDSMKLENYTGPIEHVFTHALVAFPELGFAGPYDVDCMSVIEYKRVLQNLYDKGYVLVRPSDVWEIGDDGKIKRKTLMLPKDKKPVIFSIDDMVYDSKKMGRGMVDKLIIKDGKIQTYTKMADGREIISDDNECIPILDKFVAEHPDFSYNGAKLTLALTGFDGIFGYRTQRDSPNREAEIEAVKPIIQMLKDTGYEFMSHSYKHGYLRKASLNYLIDDLQKWKNEVESLVGPTFSFAYPYGAYEGTYKTVNDKVKELEKFGFRILCGVGAPQFTAVVNDGKMIFMDRTPFTGEAFRLHASKLARFFDVNEIYDKENRVVPLN
ncbi:MAG TPA: polysaccharide deacetylase family protein [Clostridia bacterium]|nr:polysaccharide deacetylase family protein [Clostridia bacterium]